MYLSEFRVYNYKSFLDSGIIALKPGINILTGQNNAGKTALLEALSTHLQNKPHLGSTKNHTPENQHTHTSHTHFRLTITQDELRKLFPSQKNQPSSIPIEKQGIHEALKNHRLSSLQGDHLKHFLYDQKIIKLDLIHSALHKGHPQPAYLFEPQRQEAGYYILTARPSEKGMIFQTWNLANTNTPTQEFSGRPISLQGLDGRNNLNINATEDITSWLSNHFHSNIYSFRAERMNIGLSQFGSEANLRPDASNLPEVLHVLQSTNPARFSRYNKLVRRVFSQVEWISVRPVGDSKVEILVWPVSPETERADLAIPLSESGTGISQILAMLYVLVTSEQPRTILIDEPNSFLHPGAVRVLVEILREHPQHQYILSTHSPELIAASNPSTVHILRRSQGVTQIESVNTQEALHFRTLLMEVGSRPSDVFGAENVLWVEGPTEQLCFPLIARHFLRRPLAGVSIVGVLHTGDFDAKKDTRSVFRIYERLTQGSALLPPAIAFIFDREIRPDKDRQDLERQSKGKVHFLSRRTYENYLLHAGALAAVMNEHPPFTDEPTNAAKVQTWLNEHCPQAKYYGKAQAQNYPQDIDAPKLLDALFGEFSENRLTYNKVEHSLALTEWLLAHAPEELKEIGELLGKVLPE